MKTPSSFIFTLHLLYVLSISSSGILPCYDNGEVYAGSWFATKELLMKNSAVLIANLSWVNGESSSTFFFSSQRRKSEFLWGDYFYSKVFNPKFQLIPGQGIPVQSADLFDFAAVHLSSLEKYASHVPNNNNRKLRRIQEILTLVGPVQNHFTLRNISRELSLSKKTLVVIPYFAQVKWRTGESFLESRPLYLNSTYWSLRAQFENIVVGVQNQKDYDFITRDSGLRFYDVILMTINASGYTRLPVALIQHVQKCLLRKSHCPYSSFTYFFYSEADMVYNFRSFEKLVNYTFQAVSKKQHSIKTGKYKKLRSRELPPLILVPHRVMTYLPGHLNIVKKKQSYGKMDMLHSQSPIESYTEVSPQLSNQPYSCCMDLFNCTTRVQWRKLAHPEVKIHSYLGLPVVLANHHYFNGGEFRTCNLTSLKTCAGETG